LKISLPYFRNRRYLRGIDWVVGALHDDARKRVGVGAVSQAIIEVEGRLDEGQIRDVLDRISKRFPLVHGRFARDWFNLAPYWKSPRAGEFPIPLEVRDASSLEQADRLLADHVNTPFTSDSEHLRFMLVQFGAGRSELGLVFDHRLLDAYGAESFFRLMDETLAGRLEEVAPKISVTEPAHLDHWKRRMRSGRMLNRMLIKLQEKDVCALAMPTPLKGRHARFVHEAMKVEESAGLIGRAFGEIGVPVLLPCAAARAVAAVRGVVTEPGLAGSQYLLFTTVNMRPPGDEWGSMFLNHFSFLFFSAPCEGPTVIPELAGGLRDQLFSNMKDQMPAAMEDAAALGRIFPRPLVARLINSMFKGRMCSFYFACLKDSGYPGTEFMGRKVVNLVHTPLAFAPPGLNLCMTWYGGHFNLVLSYFEGAIGDEAARGVLRKFKESLVG
jgi:hypothetical protein